MIHIEKTDIAIIKLDMKISNQLFLSLKNILS